MAAKPNCLRKKQILRNLQVESLELRQLLSSDGIAPEPTIDSDELIPHGVLAGQVWNDANSNGLRDDCLLYTSPSPRDATLSRMPSSA